MAKVRNRKGWLLIDYYDEAGKRHRKTLHLKANRENKKKAEVEKKKVEYELEAGIHVEKKKREQTRNITLSKGLDEFLDIKSDKKESTKECYELAVKKFIKIMCDMKISEIDTETIKLYDDKVKYEKTKANKIISKNTIASYNNQLLVIFNFFLDKGYIEKNPFEHKEIQINEVVTFSDKAIKNILKKLKKKNIEHYKIIAMLLITGLRVSEMINLSFSDIDFDEDIINFKNEKEDRYDKIPLHPVLKEFILTHWKDYEGKLFNYKSRHSLHFFKKLLKDQHMEKYSLHTLRKTYITKLLNSKISIYDVKTLGRHKNIKTTFKHYANAELRRMGNEVNRRTNLGTLLGTRKKKVLKLVKKVKKLDTAA